MDYFKNNEFDANAWSTTIITKPEEVKQRLSSMNLVGRRIKQLKLIGLSYFHTRDWIGDSAYGALKNLPEEERQEKSKYENINPKLLFPRCSQIDEPLLIEFEDGDTFEIDIPFEGEIRVGMNLIPWNIDAGTNLPNLDANIMFSPCIGQKVTKIEMNTFTRYYRNSNSEKLVDRIIIRLENGVGISIGGEDFDYCAVKCINKRNKVLKIPFSKLKPALYNREDLRIDKALGFEADTGTFYFGEKSLEYIKVPYLSLKSNSNDSVLYIRNDNFTLFCWSITNVMNKMFDEYGRYGFSYKQWWQILNEAEKIISLNSFDELFDYLVAKKVKFKSGKNMYLTWLNENGKQFWEKKRLYINQLEDMKKWTNLVLKEKGTLFVGGF